MGKQTSELRTLLPCPDCGRGLNPATVESGVAFYCKNGHQCTITDLLQAQSDATKGGLEQLLAQWQEQYENLIRTAEDARKNGCLDVAEIFHRHAKSLESRMRKVSEAFSRPDSTKLLRLPGAWKGARAEGL